MKKEISEAIQKDLGREEFATWFSELMLLEHELDHTLKNLKSWMKPESVDTPMFLGPAKS